MGDVSLGIEHLYKKRISQEFQAYVKCFSSVVSGYDKGFRFNYQLKYNFIHRERFRMSVNASTSYQEYGFNRKETSWFEQYPDVTIGRAQPLHMMDRHYERFGIGGGFGLNMRLSKHFFIGSDILLEISKIRKSYTVLAQREPVTRQWVYFPEPIVYREHNFSGFIFYAPLLNLKLSYLF